MATKKEIYDVALAFDPRIISEHFGRDKYTSSVQAIGELVANALNANATLIDIDVYTNPLGGIDTITVEDNGTGISRADMKSRFGVVGIKPRISSSTRQSFSRFGIGRLAVFRIGARSEWTSVAVAGDEVFRTEFALSEDVRTRKIKVTQEKVAKDHATGTKIKIFNIVDSNDGSSGPTAARIESGILAQFCSHLLSHKNVNIRVQDEPILVEKFIEHSENEELAETHDTPYAMVSHVLLKKELKDSRFPAQVLFCSSGRTIATSELERAVSGKYLCIVECPYLDTIVSSNRESVIELDGKFARLKSRVAVSAKAFSKRIRDESAGRFLEDAREESYYPYRGATSDPLRRIRQAQFDNVLLALHDRIDLSQVTNKYKEVIFRLLDRAIQSDNVLDVLREVVKLSDADMSRFKQAIEITSLESVIHLGSAVATRLQYLNALHEIVYGDGAKHIRERTQLHLIVEEHCWLFGPQFNLAVSDKSMRSILKQHRISAGLPPMADADVASITGINEIPDLFLVATSASADAPRRRHAVVEIKAPNVTIRKKEIDEINDYARTIMGASEFDKAETSWDMFIVSAAISDEIDQWHRGKEVWPYHCIQKVGNMRIWCFTWAELIERARSEMLFAMDHIRIRSADLNATEFLKRHHPDVFAEMHKARVKKAGSVPPPSPGAVSSGAPKSAS